MLPAYAELHCLSNFSFLRGASHPEELVERARTLSYRAFAITDECSIAGAVRAHLAAQECGLPLIIGTEVTLADGVKLVLLATDRASYGNLCQLITRGRRQAPKGTYHLTRDDVGCHAAGLLALWVPASSAGTTDVAIPDTITAGQWVRDAFHGRAWLAAGLFARARDVQRVTDLTALGIATDLPVVATGDVHMHVRARRPLQDTLTAIRLGKPLAECGFALFPNGERFLRSRGRLGATYPAAWLAQTIAVADRCTFSLASLRYEYPEEIVPAGATPAAHLRTLVEAGLLRRFGSADAVPAEVRALIEHELALIRELGYEPYFLTVHDIVAFARAKAILCQGRGSAANSAVCYALGITEVDPSRMSMLFERFISKERNEPPDIDVDFEHERREEVMQYVYGKYGRDRAALAATLITYRPKSAVCDVGKALGMDLAQVDRLAGVLAWWDGRTVAPERIREAGFDPDNPVILRLIALVNELLGFPRHLSQHVGGFVIARELLERMVPVENAAMVERTVIQWDKDDLDALGLLKVDCLALGMLTAIRKALDLIGAVRGRPLRMQDIPAEDPAVYAMVSEADTIGVFQIESRAQQSMLPRLKPACFYDLVIEVAIVRPGPIQGGMIHPYLRRRQGLEPVTYPSTAVKSVLERTLGVPIFQEQVMQLAIVAAGFSPGEADQLRRSMAAWRRGGALEKFGTRLVEGMRARGYTDAFARQICSQIQGFGEYGFPESHSASFALLVYVSAWLKRHQPAAFCAALLNAQPMGFYAPAQLVQDARRHGVEVRPIDVMASDWDCTLE
ncbi:MAG: error-prone DNA polymerase, partial [Casimicrobiaceae bacterium]